MRMLAFVNMASATKRMGNVLVNQIGGDLSVPLLATAVPIHSVTKPLEDAFANQDGGHGAATTSAHATTHLVTK